MNVIRSRAGVRVAPLLVLVAAVAGGPAALAAQAVPVTRLVVEPATVSVQAGQVAPVRVTAYDAQGLVVADPPIRVSGARGACR